MMITKMNDVPVSDVKKRGFTLIELLVVITIISLVAAILFPVFAKAREQARKASCQSNLKQIGISLMMYIQDYDGTYPARSMGYKVNDSTQLWCDVLQPYAKSYQIWVCPDSGPVYGATGRKFSYGMNTYGESSATGGVGYGFGNDLSGTGTHHGTGGGPVKEPEIGNASEVIFAGDPASNGMGGSYPGILVGYSNDNSYIPVLHGGQIGPFIATTEQPVDESMGGGNYLFADGHVKFLQVQKLIPRAARAPYFNIGS
jgi:prepilin-type N-terminal cleavage/methylation domain-containing protein/prepilin-type processing-associated H-X9-DG protein